MQRCGNRFIGASMLGADSLSRWEREVITTNLLIPWLAHRLDHMPWLR